jgi:quercetin dioxygenase-like cupin family protein
MDTTRIFKSADAFQPIAEGDPVVAWFLLPGQTIAPHIHPHGQDTWTILTGQGDYTIDAAGTTQAIVAGDVVIAPVGCVHGVRNTGDEPLSFISIVAPAAAGYQLVDIL